MWSRFKTSKLYKVLTNRFFLVTLFFVVWMVFFDTNNLIEWTRALQKLGKNHAVKAYYKEQIEKTESQLRLLESNRDSLEKFARERYYFLTDSEDVYIVAPAPRRK